MQSCIKVQVPDTPLRTTISLPRDFFRSVEKGFVGEQYPGVQQTKRSSRHLGTMVLNWRHTRAQQYCSSAVQNRQLQYRSLRYSAAAKLSDAAPVLKRDNGTKISEIFRSR
eukprot:1224288-Rhodomonas_salina.2